MLNGALIFAFAAVGLSMILCMVRMVRGPDIVDRITALDTLYVNTIAVLIVVGIHLHRDTFFEAALLIAMMGFVGTVTLAKHIRRGSIIE